MPWMRLVTFLSANIVEGPGEDSVSTATRM